MATFHRSTTGCTACKNRRKKCDEGKPQCRRCLVSGIPCSYDFIVHPSNVTHLIERTRPAPRPIAELLAKLSSDRTPLDSVTPPSSGHLAPSSSSFYANSNSPGAWGSQTPNINLTTSCGEIADVPSPIGFMNHRQLLSHPNPTGPSGPSQRLTGVSRNSLVHPTGLTPQATWSSDHGYEMDEEVDDPEEIYAILCMPPTMDRNVKENTLSFVLQCSTRSSEPFVFELDKQDAMRILDNTLEIMTLQLYTQSMAACIQLMEEAAPVFRCACPGPAGQPLNLSNILLESGLNLRHYASIDIMTSALTGRPTFFKYHVPFSLELCEQIFQSQESSGLHWLHGVPDQFILMIAWINSLREMPGASTDSGLISQIERDLSQIRISGTHQGDSALRIGRMVVQECWRYAVFIYLYMALGKADASDPRVIYAQKQFMRLVKGIKPGRNPDAFLVSPMILAGIATCKERDRNMLRQRVLNLREYTTPHTSGNDAWMQVEDVWTRTGIERRTPVWSDLRIACFRISGK
ncbi:unnamed protein product [Rhizoctonia solani]|uniref:Zn(2)-C6 fungal-type domain-containing protein n=1 Tax=Rhizoctonia solani TaxID=456999 RepID=A0A8H3DF57_9AGAM|nr:unnamed protein product [Rhizoctonia solani]